MYERYTITTEGERLSEAKSNLPPHLRKPPETFGKLPHDVGKVAARRVAATSPLS
jgi:hypothetical protein